MVRKSTVGITRLNLVESQILDFQLVRTLSYQLYGGASTGEVIRVANELKTRGNTRENWINIWTEQGEHCRKLAEEAIQKGQNITARNAYLRAYNYLRAAEFYYDHSDPEAHRDFYLHGLECFDKATALFDYPVEKIEIPYINGIKMPGYFFQPADNGIKCPTVIVCGGGDGFGEELYFVAGVPEALARGMNVLVFHGPGQRGLLHRHPDMVFRADYEVPMKFVVDYTIKRNEVDAERLAMYGISLGGYLVPRAAAFDHRIKAIVANAPIYSFHDFMMGSIVGVLPKYTKTIAEHLVERLSASVWDRIGKSIAKKSWDYAATMELYDYWTNGVKSLSEYVDKINEFDLHGLESRITCPTLCISPEGEGEEPVKQAQDFYNVINAPKTFYTLTVEDGADNHVGLNNITYTSSIVYDWIKKTFESS